MKKRLALLLAILMLASVAVACAPTTEPEASPTVAPEQTQAVTPTESPAASVDPSTWKVAVLIPGSATDGGFCQLGAEAGKALEAKYGCKVSIIEAATADLMKSEAESLAEEGYNIIYGHGGQYAAPFAEISPNYPNTYFPTCGGETVTANQFPINITLEQATYVGGVVAGMITKTNKIGMLVGGDFPSYTKTTRALELGAKSVNDKVETMFAVLTNVDMNEAYETTMNQIESGADVIFSNANQGTLGSLKAAGEKNVMTLGALTDYTSEYGNIIFASAMCDYNAAYAAAFDRCVAGITEPSILFTGMADGTVTFLWNDTVKATLPAEVVKAAEDTIAKIKSGEIKVPNEYE